jgi:predicted protein tyrosine phosphatase
MIKGGDFRAGCVFLFLSVASVFPGILVESALGKFVAFSAAIAFLAVAVAYTFSWPGLIGKKRAGGLLTSSYALFWPFHFLNYLSLTMFRWSRQSAPFSEIFPGLYLGGRLTSRDARRLCELNISAVLDLTCEFSEIHCLRTTSAYLCIPLLDRTAPSPAELEAAIRFIREQSQGGSVYVHCALGHGRSATVMLAYLLATRKFTNVEEALAHVQSKRPRVRLNRSQLRALQQFTA